MENANLIVLPYILDALSEKLGLCDTYENLFEELEEILSAENVSGNKRKLIQMALDQGERLGILTLTDENIRLPCKFRTNLENNRRFDKMANRNQNFDEDISESEYNDSPKSKQNPITPKDSKRLRDVAPNMIPHGPSKRRSTRSRSRRNSRKGSSPGGQRRRSSRQGKSPGSQRRRSGSRRSSRSGSARRRSRSTQR